MTQKRRNEITGLRGLSACAIAYIFHYTELFHTMPERFPIQAAVMGFLARYGVCMSEIFFMLSGLLLYWSYQKRLSEGELRLGSFILPKMKKIYPMMMASALVTWLLQKVGYAIYGVYILHPDGAGVRNSLKALLVSLLGLQTGWISDNDTLGGQRTVLVCQCFLCLLCHLLSADALCQRTFVAECILYGYDGIGDFPHDSSLGTASFILYEWQRLF